MRAPRLTAAVAATAALLAGGCGDDSGNAEPPDDADVVIVAEAIQFDVSEIEVPADEPVLIADVNRDSVAHNVHITDAPDSPKTDLRRGPSVQTMEVTFPEGEYVFICDLHPNMRGTIAAAPGAAVQAG